MDWFDREEDLLVEQVNSGAISRKEFDDEMRALRAEYRRQAEEAAQEAYDSYFDRGFY